MSIDFEGIELSDEQKQKIEAKVNSTLEGFVPKSEFDAVLGNRDELLTEKKQADEKRRLAEEQANAQKLEAAKKNNDIESLTNSYEEKIKSLQSEIDGFQSEKKTNAVSSIAQSFIDENVTSDPVVRNAIKGDLEKRLDLRDGKPAVLDADGNLTALSVDDLFNEFKAASVYKPHLVASKASGGGANGSKGSSAGGDLADKSLADCKTSEERQAVYDAKLARGSYN